MKNLKKTLALVLAVVMVLGLCVMGNAAFKDEDKISDKYMDACGVMNGLGILKGDENGVFNPQGTLTRGQAAKIITYLKLGSAADYLKATEAPFDDVPVTAWEAPFISFCKNSKIVAGYGNGMYGKDDTLSGYAFAKMLLTAIGYGAGDEYVGDDWKVAVAKDGLGTGLFKGVEGFLSDAALPREVAAQLGFNAACIPQVQYIKLLEMYQPFGGTLAETVLNLNPTPVLSETDSAGRPMKRYYTENAPYRVVYETAADPVFTTVDGFTVAALQSQKNFDFTYFNDGFMNRDGGRTPSYFEDEYGSTVEFYGVPQSDGRVRILSIVGTRYQFARVTAINAATRTITIDVNGSTYTYSQTYEPNSYKILSAFSVGDCLCALFDYATSSYDDVISADKAEGVTGDRITATNSGTLTTPPYIRIDGTQYKFAISYPGTMPAAGSAVGGTYYLNPNGYIIGYVGTAASVVAQTNYVYIVRLQTRAPGDMLNPAGAAAKAEAIFCDGTHKAIDLTLTANRYAMPDSYGGVTPNTAVTDYAATIGAWFNYAEASDGSYTLSPINSDYAQVASSNVTLVEKTSAVLFGKYTTSATKIVAVGTNFAVENRAGLVSASYNANPLGYPNAILVSYAKNSNTVAAIYAVGQTLSIAPVTKTYARAIAAGDTVVDGTEWRFYIGGNVESYVIAGVAPIPGEVYTLTKDLIKDCYTATPETKAVTGGTIAVADTTFVVVGSTTFNLVQNSVIYDVRFGHNGEAGTLAAGMKVDIVCSSGTNVGVIYIVD